MKTNKTEQFEIIRIDSSTDTETILAIFDTKEEALAYGEKLAENISDDTTLACVKNHIIENEPHYYESMEIYEVWDKMSDRIIAELS